MNLKIGTTIKSLRAKHKVTQDQLATFLGCTPQAISRWESETSYPDIELLPSIAAFFSVSTDELLGLKLSEREQRRAEIYDTIARCCETGADSEEDIRTARSFAAEFPSDEKIQAHLADTLCRAYMWDGKAPDYQKELEEAERIYLTLIERTDDQEFRNGTLETLAALYVVGFQDKLRAERTIHQLPSMRYCREGVRSSLFSYFLGEDPLPAQDYILRLTETLCSQLTEYVAYVMPNEPEGWDRKIEYFEKILDLYRTVFGDDLNYFHARVAYVHRVIATYLIAQGKTDETLDRLELMYDHVIAADKAKPGDPFTSPLTDRLVYPEASDEFDDLRCANHAYYFAAKMKQERYDPIREHPRFVALCERLREAAREF